MYEYRCINPGHLLSNFPFSLINQVPSAPGTNRRAEFVPSTEESIEPTYESSSHTEYGRAFVVQLSAIQE